MARTVRIVGVLLGLGVFVGCADPNESIECPPERAGEPWSHGEGECDQATEALDCVDPDTGARVDVPFCESNGFVQCAVGEPRCVPL